MWSAGYRLGFTEATVFQDRNAHNYMRDFESEVTMYLETEKVHKTVINSVDPVKSIVDNLFQVYSNLNEIDIVQDKELILLESWLTQLIKK